MFCSGPNGLKLFNFLFDFFSPLYISRGYPIFYQGRTKLLYIYEQIINHDHKMEPAINVQSLSLPKPERRKLAQFFRKILLFFEKHGIVAVAAHGTLLGLVRNGDLLDYDDDLDMDIDEDNLRKLKELFVDGKCTIVDGPSKTILEFTKTRRDQYSIHYNSKRLVQWPFIDLFVQKIGAFEQKAFALKNNSNRVVSVNIPVRSTNK